MIRRIFLALVLAAMALPARAADTAPDGKDPNSKSYLLGDYGAKPHRAVPAPNAAAQDPSLIRRPAERWPWLEAGTIVCSSEDDLQRYHEVIAARLNGQPSAGGVAACRRLTQRTQIDIAARRGPATTEILLNSDAKQAAWTDVWLPAQRPN